MALWTDGTIRMNAACGILFCVVVSIGHADEKSVSPRAPWTTSRLQGAPDPPSPYRIEAVFPSLRFEKPTSIEQFPDQERLLVTQNDGKIFSFLKNWDVQAAELVADLKSQLPDRFAGQEVSLFDAEFHPDFHENRYVFVCYVHPGEGGHTRLARLTLSREFSPRLVPGSESVLMTWPSGPHNAGCLEFGRDGYLYISTGDGSGPNPPDGLTTGQDISDLLGAILRIDVDHADGERTYTIPSDNPFANLAGARPEVWAYGLRNPWKFGVDPESENIFAADNGWETWEMVHRIVRGGNCGWPVMEGRAELRTEVPLGPTPIIPPVKDHPHTEANSVIGGPVYRGSRLPDLAGSFIYGDYITGTIWAIRSDANNDFSHTTLTDTDQRIVAFTEGSKGELYVLDYDFTGQVYELRPSGLEDTSSSFPRRLSETGLFASLRDLKPAAGVVPYEVQVERWMDGAEAQRWVAIPGAGQIRLSMRTDTPAFYPEGTVLVKHLRWPLGQDREPIRLETQILHYENQRWHPYSYLWDDAGEDAYLVESTGADRPLRNPDEAVGPHEFRQQTWHVSATNECKLCHNPGSRFVLGFSPHALNRQLVDAAETNQLVVLAEQKVLTQAPVISSDDPSRLVDPHDVSQDLDERARSYLHTNCGICHHPGGNAIVSFYLRRDMPLGQLNTNKGTIIGTFGMQDPKIIMPGDPYRSLLFYRMAKLGYARMPYIGSHVVDSAGVTMIERWIRSLPSDASYDPSPPLKERSVESRALHTLREGSSAPRAERDRALRELVKSTEGTLALVARMHQGSLSQADFQAAIQLGREARTDIRGLIEPFVPESQRRKTLGPTIRPDSILGRDGDFARGKLIYFSDAARCRACHEINDRSDSLGPTLAEINKKYPRPADLLQHVLQPSLQIDDQFATYTVLTDDGRTVTGLVTSKTDTEVVIKTAEKKIVRIAHRGIEELRRSQKSLMPDFLLSDLTPQEAADLLEYIRAPR